jgi:PPM family protein phosphatase
MIEYGAHSATGTRHQTNEDAHGALPKRQFWVVADGMGGHAAGNVASQVVRDHVLAEISKGHNITEAIQAAHTAVVNAAAEDPARRGMGSTVVAAKLEPPAHTATIGWVGDSRAYLLRDGALQRLTRDHSLVQLMVDRREITAAQAETHPERNVLVRSLGFDTPRVDQVRVVLHGGDTLLLCTDGVSTLIDDARIAQIISGAPSAQAAAEALVQAVVDQGGGDDATAVVIRYNAPMTSWMPIVAGIVLGLAAFLTWVWTRSAGPDTS